MRHSSKPISFLASADVPSRFGGILVRNGGSAEERLTFAPGVLVLVSSSLLFSAPSTYTSRCLIRRHSRQEPRDYKQDVVLTRGFRMPNLTVPAGTDLRRLTVSDRVSWSIWTWLTDTSWSPGSKPP